MFNVSLAPEFGVKRDLLMQMLRDKGIETREAFVPINKQKIFLERGYVKEGACPIANDIMDNGLYLPSGLGLKDEDIDAVFGSRF